MPSNNRLGAAEKMFGGSDQPHVSGPEAKSRPLTMWVGSVQSGKVLEQKLRLPEGEGLCMGLQYHKLA
jgi:hypothetical protein